MSRAWAIKWVPRILGIIVVSPYLVGLTVNIWRVCRSVWLGLVVLLR